MDTKCCQIAMNGLGTTDGCNFLYGPLLVPVTPRQEVTPLGPPCEDQPHRWLAIAFAHVFLEPKPYCDAVEGEPVTCLQEPCGGTYPNPTEQRA
jgi:hypothetical protein